MFGKSKISVLGMTMLLGASVMILLNDLINSDNARISPKLLPDSEDSVLNFDPREITLNETIFFLETNTKAAQFNPRLLCAFESAAKFNPDLKVFVLLVESIGDTSKVFTTPHYLRRVENLHFRRLTQAASDSIARGTAVEHIWISGHVASSKYGLNNISNILRILLVFKFGGYYLDSDIVARARFPRTPNFVLQDVESTINNAFIRFEANHPFLQDVLKELVRFWATLGSFVK